MKLVKTFGLCLAVGLMAISARAAELSGATELKSGPQPGDMLGAFEVTKVAGAPEDGVEVGQELCYRCKMGNRPMVMVFSRKADKSLAKLVQKLDTVVAKNKTEKNMGSFVSLIGEKPEELTTAGKKLVDDSKAKNVAVVVPKDQPNGPEDYKLNPKAETTVLIYVKGKVLANHALSPGALNDAAAEKIIADTAKILD